LCAQRPTPHFAALSARVSISVELIIVNVVVVVVVVVAPPLKKFESAFKGNSRFLVQFLRPLNVRSAVAESAFAICSTLLCYTIKKQKTFFILNKFFIQVRDQCQLICNILHLRKKLSQECVQFSRAYL
jgi:hypothetical protein